VEEEGREEAYKERDYNGRDGRREGPCEPVLGGVEGAHDGRAGCFVDCFLYFSGAFKCVEYA